MIIKIGEYECTECCDGVFYKKLSDYPNITEFYLDNDCKDIWSWSEKVYEFVKGEKR